MRSTAAEAPAVAGALKPLSGCLPRDGRDPASGLAAELSTRAVLVAAPQWLCGGVAQAEGWPVADALQFTHGRDVDVRCQQCT